LSRYTTVPAISGSALISLLIKKDNWKVEGVNPHGRSLSKRVGNQTLVTTIADTSKSLPEGTLGAILGPKQTQLGKQGLLRLLNDP